MKLDDHDGKPTCLDGDKRGEVAPPTQVDVIIVGAGPTGLTLANYLGRCGVSVLLVEANPSTVEEPRAVSIDDEALRAIQELGLLDVVVAETVPGYGTDYWSPRKLLFLKVRPVARPFGHPRRSAFRQPVLEAQLRAGLHRYPNVQIQFETTASSIVQDDRCVRVALRRGDAMQDATARFLVGADGGRSVTRTTIGAQLVGKSIDERWLIVDLENAGSDQSDTIVFCDPRRSAISLPGPRDTHRFEFKLHPHEAEDDLLRAESIARLLAQHEAPRGAKVVRSVVYRFHALLADRWGDNRIWLAGDAAHLSPPFAGQGMNSGIRDAINLGWKLDLVLKYQFGPALLSTYQVERRDHVSQMIQLATRIGVVMGPRSQFSAAATRVAFHTLRLWPAARRYFAEMRFKPPPRFHDGFLVRSHVKGKGAVGRMLPQPRLAGGPGAGQLLDDWLGRGFVLVGIGVEEAVVALISLGERWDALIAKRAAIPVACAPELADLAGTLLLLRPDRYVMVQFEAANAPWAAQQLARLGDETAGPRDRTAIGEPA